MALHDQIAALCDAAGRRPPDDIVPVLATALDTAPERLAIFLADYSASVLLEFSRDGAPGERFDGGGSAAEEAYRAGAVRYSGEAGAFWTPIVARGAPLGVLRYTADDTPDERERARLAGRLAGILLNFAEPYTAIFDRARRCQEMGMGAELQWSNLPPTTYRDDGISIAAAIEPAYDIGGDAIDYNVTRDVIEFAQFDAIGHGASAAVISLMALGSWRAACRNGCTLAEAAAQLAADLYEMTDSGDFVSGVIGRIERSSGRLEWINAGHPQPFFLRPGSSETLETPEVLPFGAVAPEEAGPHHRGTATVDVGATFVLASDGLTGNPDPFGASPSNQEVIDDLAACHEGGGGAIAIVRHAVDRVIERRRGDLEDDATVLAISRAG